MSLEMVESNDRGSAVLPDLAAPFAVEVCGTKVWRPSDTRLGASAWTYAVQVDGSFSSCSVPDSPASRAQNTTYARYAD